MRNTHDYRSPLLAGVLALLMTAGVAVGSGGCKGDIPASDGAARDKYIAGRAPAAVVPEGQAPRAASDPGSAAPAAEGDGAVVVAAPSRPRPRAKRIQPAASVQITVVSGEGLPDLDDGPGVTDAYIVLDYDGTQFKTSIDASLTPKWGDSFVFDLRQGASLSVTAMDQDTVSDEKIGVTTVSVPMIGVGEEKLLDVAFRDGDNGTVRLKLVGH